ncbi:GNAT family N-acetyltransferase [Microvirga sp. W0021]|uniref:GNAT family N-acetyltransferase n=1 Tax=Hohaiivirga grylli TaxID=3133970 RepID=A0ABV0BJN0_9HYPH
MACPELTTSRLKLRKWKAEDFDVFAALNADPEVMRYFPDTLTRTESDALANRIQEQMEQSPLGLWALELKSNNRFIGFTGLAITRFEAHFTPCTEIGWRLTKAYWGHGYVTEAAQTVLEYAFTKLHLPEVVSFTVSENQRSRRVMERLGMHHNPTEDFDHPALPNDHPLRRHVLYRLNKKAQ